MELTEHVGFFLPLTIKLISLFVPTFVKTEFFVPLQRECFWFNFFLYIFVSYLVL